MKALGFEFGIRWPPTILGALLVIWGFVWIASGLAAPLKSPATLLLGLAFLAFGVGLLRVGRRGITRSLKSAGKTDAQPHE